MNASTQQIVTAYEDAGMTPELIHTELFPDIDLSLIKAALAQNSARYNELHKQEDTSGLIKSSGVEDVTDDEFNEIKIAFKNLALYGEDEGNRSRALKFLWNEKKGRNDVDKNKQLKGAPQINIFQLNLHMQKAREAIERARSGVRQQQQQVIDVATHQPA